MLRPVPPGGSANLADYITQNNTNISNLQSANTGLQTQVNANKQSIQGLASGSPKGSYANVAAIVSANPDTGVYIAQDNGHVYSWVKNGSNAIDLGVYQATVPDSSIEDLNKRKVSKENKNNYYNPLTNVDGYVNSSGNITSGNYITTDFIYLNNGDSITIDTLVRFIGLYNINKVFDSYIISTSTYGYTYTATAACYIRVSIPNYLKYCNIYKNNIKDDISYISLATENNIKLSELNKGEIYTIIGDTVGNTYTDITLNFTTGKSYSYQTNELSDNSNGAYTMLQVKAGECYRINGYSWHGYSLFVFVDENDNRLPFPYNGYSTNVIEHNNINFIVPKNGVLYINKIGNREVTCEKVSINSLVNISSSNVLYNKKYIACGDSFTNGDYTNSSSNNYLFTDGIYQGLNKVYPRYIALRNNMNLVMDAWNGSTMTYISGRNHCFSEENGRYTQIPADVDYITLKFGINDDAYHQNPPLGTIDDNVNTTYYGAWNIVLDYLIRNHPNAKIGIIITNGASLAIVNATIAIAKKWGIAYLNEALGEDVPLMLRSNRTDVTQSIKDFRNSYWAVNSGTETPNSHPNELAHEYESTIVENFLRRL